MQFCSVFGKIYNSFLAYVVCVCMYACMCLTNYRQTMIFRSSLFGMSRAATPRLLRPYQRYARSSFLPTTTIITFSLRCFLSKKKCENHAYDSVSVYKWIGGIRDVFEKHVSLHIYVRARAIVRRVHFDSSIRLKYLTRPLLFTSFLNITWWFNNNS